MCSGGESYYLYSLTGHPNQDWKTTAYIFDFFTILLVFSRPVRSFYRENCLTRLVARLGVASFAVYLTHILVMIPVFKMFPFAGVTWTSKWVVALLASWLFVEVLKKLFPVKCWRYLGLR